MGSFGEFRGLGSTRLSMARLCSGMRGVKAKAKDRKAKAKDNKVEVLICGMGTSGCIGQSWVGFKFWQGCRAFTRDLRYSMCLAACTMWKEVRQC